VAGRIDFEAIRCPTLVMSGADDRFVDARNAQILAEKIDDARVVIVPETDHLFFLEKPRRVAEEIARFLEAP